MKGKNEFENGKRKPMSRKQKIVMASALLAVLVLVLLLCLSRCNHLVTVAEPTLIVETPPKVAAGQSDTIVTDVRITALGDAIYPAMSMCLQFDSSRLEFLGIEEGNVFILNDEKTQGIAQKLPDWSVNVAQSNRSGQINIMYLDMTGGKYAFSRELLSGEDSVLLRLRFRLRGSAKSGDVLALTLADAVFAASDETQSLAMTTGTLKTRDGRIVVGE